ncbi:MAG: hypothetical protein C4318_05745 [Acidimicrobiia bacterium]
MLQTAVREGYRRFLADPRPGPVAKVVLDHPTRDVHYDYLVPPNLSPSVRVGSLVWVPSRNRRSRGWVVGFSEEIVAGLKQILSLGAPFPLLSLSQVRLAAAAAEYYLTDIRRFLRRMTPPTSLRSATSNTALNGRPFLEVAGGDRSAYELDRETSEKNEAASWLRDALVTQGYEIVDTNPVHEEGMDCDDLEVILVRHPPGHPPVSVFSEFFQRLRAGGQSSLVALGSAVTADAKQMLAALGSDYVFIDTKAPTKVRAANWSTASSPGCVIAGDRAVVLQRAAPLGAVCVLNEASPSHIEDRIPYYNARTVALLRARIERCSTILAAPWPSYDARASRTRYIQPGRDVRKALFPKVVVVDRSKEVPEPGHIAPFSARLVRNVVGKGGRAVLFVTKKGEYRSQRCTDCWFTMERDSYTRCPRCGSERLRLAGPGVAAIEDEARRLFPGFSVGHVVKDGSGTPGSAAGASASIVVATEAALWRLDRVQLVVVVSFESLVGLVSFDAWHRTARILYDLCALLVRGQRKDYRKYDDEVPGAIAIQTYHSDHPVLQAFAQDEENLLLDRDLVARKAEWLPPYSRAVLVESPDETGKALIDEFAERLASVDRANSRLEIAGPHDDGKHRRALVLHDGSVSLWEPVSALRKAAETKGARVRVEVDPDASYRQL